MIFINAPIRIPRREGENILRESHNTSLVPAASLSFLNHKNHKMGLITPVSKWYIITQLLHSSSSLGMSKHRTHVSRALRSLARQGNGFNYSKPLLI